MIPSFVGSGTQLCAYERPFSCLIVTGTVMLKPVNARIEPVVGGSP